MPLAEADTARGDRQAPPLPKVTLATAPAATHRRHDLLVIGVIATSVGAVMAGVGTALMVANNKDRFSSDRAYSDDLFEAGADLVFAGGVELLAGVPLLILALITVADEPAHSLSVESSAPTAAFWTVTPILAGSACMGLGVRGTL